MPYAPRPDDGRVWHKYDTPTAEVRLTASYAGISVQQVIDLDFEEYLRLRRDAVIHAFSKTKDGIEYLNEAWAREQEEPDRAALREAFG